MTSPGAVLKGGGMRSLRHLVRHNLPAAWVVIAFALALRMLVPTGFMPVFDAGGIRIALCSGMSMGAQTSPASGMAMAHSGMPAMHHGDAPDAPAKPDMPCAFAGLSAPVHGGADGIQIAIAVATALAASLFFTPQTPPAHRTSLRPPLRGPPAIL